MKNNILIINGATRKNGNTDQIINTIIEGNTNKETNMNTIILRDQKISDCIGCHICHKKSKCSINDDMAKVYNSMNESDLIIFASPIYWWGVTGIMKIFIDRLYFYHSENNKRFISGKKTVVIAPMNMKQDNYKTEIFLSFYDILFENLELVKANTLLFDNINERGEILNRPDLINKALIFGKNLKFPLRFPKEQLSNQSTDSTLLNIPTSTLIPFEQNNSTK